MIEWLALILLVPVILVPIVLLFGFAGCTFGAAHDPELPLPEPGIEPTPNFEKAFEATLAGEQQWRNRCIVQRIESVRLLKSGNEVRITLQRPASGNLLIKSISISHAADTPGANLYDSAGDPMLQIVPGDFPLLLTADPGNAAVELIPVSFPLDRMKPLLLAFDIDDPGNVRRSAPGTEADTAAFVGPLQNPPLHEAAIGPRQPGYNPEERTYLVQRIAVREV